MRGEGVEFSAYTSKRTLTAASKRPRDLKVCMLRTSRLLSPGSERPIAQTEPLIRVQGDPEALL